MQLSQADKIIHEKTLALSRKYKRVESELVVAMQEVASRGIHKKLGRSNLNRYAVIELELSEAVAQCFVTVANKAKRIPTLQRAIENGSLSVSKASRIVSALTLENAEELVNFAIQNSCRRTKFEVARINPKAASPDRIIPLSEDLVEMRVCLPRKVLEDLERVQSLVSQQESKPAGFSKAIERLITDFLKRHDPVRKAEQAMIRKARQKMAEGRKGLGETSYRTSDYVESLEATNKSEAPTKSRTFRISSQSEQTSNLNPDPTPKVSTQRVPLTAEQRHAVNLRDQGRCTYCDSSGNRCENHRWVEIHHVIHVQDGGSNDPSNLTTLCWFHHDLIHQLSFDLDRIGDLKTG